MGPVAFVNSTAGAQIKKAKLELNFLLKGDRDESILSYRFS